jgi:CRISPR type IV-associated protein Csf2
MTTKTEWYAGTVTALSSISHIGPDGGGQNNTSYLRREKVVQPDGTVEMVPVISGNGMRGLLRDRGMWHMCGALGYGVNPETGEVLGLGLPAFHFLFSGGTLTSVAGRGLDIDAARRVRELIPLVGVFGGAMGNQIMEGKLKIGKLIPVCQEAAHLLPEWCFGGQLASVFDLTQQEAFTRKDDEHNERLRQIIAPEVRALLEAKAAEKREAKGTKDEKPDAEVGQHQQMLYYVETLAAGTRFFWELALEDVTDVEYDAFWVAMAEWARAPYIGGKSGTGHGKVKVNFRDWMAIDPNAYATSNLPGLPMGARYQQHLRDHGAEMREMLAQWT